MSEDKAEMPCYRSHKIVHALKIAKLQSGDVDKNTVMFPVETEFEPILLTRDYVEKHNPQVGGYYIVYEDGYKSWSPAETFESGYTRIGS